MDVSPPGITKKRVHVLFIRSEVKLADIQRLGMTPPARITMPALDEEQPPEDLFPEQKIVEAETTAAGEAPLEEPVEEKTLDDVTEDDVPDLNAVFRVCFHFWQMQPVEVCGQLGYKTVMDVIAAGVRPWDAWLTIKSFKQPKEK